MKIESGTLQRIAAEYRIAKGERKKELAWEIVWRLSRYSLIEPFWDFVRRELKINPEHVKEAMRFLEELGELEIKRSVDGKRLYVSTLKRVRKAPRTLDDWIGRTN